MKYAFSTLACPNWSIEHIVEQARRMGYDGIELRLLDGEVIDPVVDYQKVIDAAALCKQQQLEICALDTSCSFNYADPIERSKQIDSLRAWIELAQAISVSVLRVFGGTGSQHISPPPTEQEVNAWVADALRQIAPEAEQAHVTIALETHDAFSSARRVASVLEAVQSPYVGALWDSHHPYRMGESIAEVLEVLGAYIVHVHVKDARLLPDCADWQLTLMGEGEVPVREQLQLLTQHGYHRYVSVEWEKKWHPELVEPEIALPQHMQWLTNVGM